MPADSGAIRDRTGAMSNLPLMAPPASWPRDERGRRRRSFVTFPAMVAAGLPPTIANASSTVALFPAPSSRHGLTGEACARSAVTESRCWRRSASPAGCGRDAAVGDTAHVFDAIVRSCCCWRR